MTDETSEKTQEQTPAIGVLQGPTEEIKQKLKAKMESDLHSDMMRVFHLLLKEQGNLVKIIFHKSQMLQLKWSQEEETKHRTNYLQFLKQFKYLAEALSMRTAHLIHQMDPNSEPYMMNPQLWKALMQTAEKEIRAEARFPFNRPDQSSLQTLVPPDNMQIPEPSKEQWTPAWRQEQINKIKQQITSEKIAAEQMQNMMKIHPIRRADPNELPELGRKTQPGTIRNPIILRLLGALRRVYNSTRGRRKSS